MKLARWKFGIAEIEKYFVDLKAYGKPEEEELLKRKTFYDIVEELIDDIKQAEEEKKLNNIKNKYNKDGKKNFNDFDNKDKNNEENNELNMVDNAINKHTEVSKVLEKIKIRKLNEERTRHIITNILVQSDLSRKAIIHSTDKYIENKNKEDIINKKEEGKIEKKEDKKDKEQPEKKNEILNKKEKEEENNDD